jgi:hypothetical protein
VKRPSLLALAALPACGHTPDTRLRPSPPAVTYAPLRQGALLVLVAYRPRHSWPDASRAGPSRVTVTVIS